VDQDQLNPYVAYEGYVVRVPHHPLTSVSVPEKYFTGCQRLGENKLVGYVFDLKPVGHFGFTAVTFLVSFPFTQVMVVFLVTAAFAACFSITAGSS
jgi:hypothetical protein